MDSRNSNFREGRFLFGFFALAAAALFIVWGAHYSLGSDEVEHLHASYMVSTGLLPYKDFWQHHSPLIWLLLSPVIQKIPHASQVVIWSRAFSSLLSLGIFWIVWRTARLLWREKANFNLTLFSFFSIAVMSQFVILRPDLFMLFFSLFSLYAAMRALEEENGIACFLSGVAMALGFSFAPKLFCWLPLPAACFIAYFWKEPKKCLKENFIYALGLVVGALPLVLYLYSHGLINDFCHWVFTFNFPRSIHWNFTKRPILWIGGFLAVLAFIWTIKKISRPAFLLVALAFFSTVFMDIFAYPIWSGKYVYYLASLFLLLCILSSGLSIQLSRFKSRSARLFLAVLLSILFLFPNTEEVCRTRKFASFEQQSKLLSWLIDGFKGQEVVAFYPWHPIYVKNVSQLYIPFQMTPFRYRNTDLFDYLAGQERWEEAVMKKRPALIAEWVAKEIVSKLRHAGFMDKESYERLADFMRQNYVLTHKYGAAFYVRKDYPIPA